MFDEDEKKRAGLVLGGLLDRQQKMANADDPFALMKQMTDTMQQPSGPINFASYLPGGANFKPPSLNSYAALARQKRDAASFSQSQSPLARAKEKRGASNPAANLSGYSYGGVAFASSSTQPRTGTSVGETNLGAIVKNADIFEKAQKREQPVDWYTKLQESKEAFLRVDNGRMPIFDGGEFRDPSGAFDQMISAKKEAKELTAKKTGKGQFKLTKGQEI